MGAAASMNNSNANETRSATKSGTTPTTATTITATDLQQWVDTVAKLNTFVGLTPSVISQLTKQLVANNEAMSFLKKIGLGFAKVEAAVHVEAKLPPELENFNILKEEKNVAAALKEKNFVQAQEAVQQKPNDAAALAALQAVVANAHKVYNTSIEARLQEVDLKNTCRKVVIAGNEDFLGVYDNMWKMTVKADRDGCDKYQTALVSLTMPNKSIKQTTSDPATLYRHAAQIFVTYQTFVNGIVESVKDEIKVSLPSKLKKMGRIIEKTILKRKDDPGNADKVCDIDRGMVLCDDMSQISSVINYLQSQQEANVIVVTRVKDRFFKAPSAGGWRDCMINFYFKDDPNKHICELQLIHNQMMTARKGLPGHAVYNRVRNASELLMLIGVKPKDKDELQKFLIWRWKTKGEKDGSLFVVVQTHPNLWDVRLITDMSGLFDIDELRDFNEDISAWDVSNVKSMEKMFFKATSFNQPIGNWNVQNVSTMEWMFYEATSFNQPIGNWNVQNVSTMKRMFNGATSFNQPIGNWNVQNVSTMERMFERATSFNQPIGNWNVQNVSTMKEMFSEATSFDQPIGNWNVQNVSNMKNMFPQATSFKQTLPDEWAKKVKYTNP